MQRWTSEISKAREWQRRERGRNRMWKGGKVKRRADGERKTERRKKVG